MKNAAIILNIISMTFLWWLIYPLIIGINANKKLLSAKSKVELGGYPIAVLLLVNVIAGVIMLSMTDQDFAD